MPAATRRLAVVVLLWLTLPARSQDFVLSPEFALKDKQSPPPFTGDALPVVTASERDPLAVDDTSLPGDLIEAVNWLVDVGFPVPTKSEYREVQLTIGGVWSNRGSRATTHAWVLPEVDPEADAQRFAIAWNGLVYPVKVTDGEVSLASDVDAMIRRDRESRQKRREQLEKRLTDKPNFPVESFMRRRRHALREGMSVSHEHLVLLRTSVLAALGELKLAERVWTAWSRGSTFDPDLPDNQRQTGRDLWQSVVHDWAWSQFDRAVCAHMRGDHVIAVASAQQTARISDVLEQNWEQLGLKRKKNHADHPQMFLPFAHSARQLAEDEQRRIDAGPIDRVLADGTPKIGDKPQRIFALIRDLEDVSETQWGQPGGVSLAASPIVKALAEEGQDAVEPLIQCIESDQRLTRSVSFHRDFFEHRNLIDVSSAAYSVVTQILGTRTFGPLTEHGLYYTNDARKRKRVAREIRAYAMRFRDSSKQDRWYQILADDDATKKQWLEAGQALVKREVDRSRIYPLMLPRWVRASDVDRWPFAGEILKARTDPSVSELLEKRARDLTKSDDPPGTISSATVFDLKSACELTLMLANWDSEAAIDPILERLDEYFTLLRHNSLRPYTKPLVTPVARLIVAGLSAGDELDRKELIEIYDQWLEELSPNEIQRFDQGSMFEPLWRYPNDAALAATARRVLTSNDSRWLPLREKFPRSIHRGIGATLFQSPLIGLPDFRKTLKSVLADRTEAGTVQVAAGGPVSIRTPGRGGSWQLRNAEDPLLPESDARIVVRICDLIASQLSDLDGTPLFEPYWPIDARDAAISQIVSFLDSWGDRYQDPGVAPARSWAHPTRAHFRLPRFERSATAEDVRAARAIFSLREEFPDREVRLAEPSAVPRVAVWTTLKQFPLVRQGINPATKEPVRTESFDQIGLLWQAEEVLIDGDWKRYYGFVGRNIVARVAAEVTVHGI